MVMGTVTWATAGVAIITDGAEAEGIITDGDTTTDDFPLMILWERGADLAAALSIKANALNLESRAHSIWNLVAIWLPGRARRWAAQACTSSSRHHVGTRLRRAADGNSGDECQNQGR
jgi:hypothetical protein